MACGSCSVGKDGKAGGCSGGCSSGSCNRLNTFDWLTALEIEDSAAAQYSGFDLVEVTFKHGARKEFFHNPAHTRTTTGDPVLVEVAGGGGYDVGHISLSGELVRLQIKKKSVKERSITLNIIRRANERDIEKLTESRAQERGSLVRARAISRMLDLDMKIGDVEYQGDGRKATFFYTADGRVDFRELIRHYAKEFKVKIEMRQIGARQESARVGGLGSCGRELCCSTWLSDFKTVSTAAARYQQLAINQSKLSGACGRLKCCLNFELDTYLDALDKFPDSCEKLFIRSGKAYLVKTDVFRGLMTYSMETGEEKGHYYTLSIRDVKSVQERLVRGEEVSTLKDMQIQQGEGKKKYGKTAAGDEEDDTYDEPDVDYEDVTGAVELKDDKRRKRKRGGKKQREKTTENGVIRPAEPRRNTSSSALRPERAEKTASAEPRPTSPKTDRSDRPERNNDRNPRPERRVDKPKNPQVPRDPKALQPAQKMRIEVPKQAPDEPINEALMFGGDIPSQGGGGGGNNKKRSNFKKKPFNKDKNKENKDIKKD